MKKSFLLAFFLITVSSGAFAQFDLSAGYSYFRPQQQMGRFINNASGLQMQGLYLIPGSRFAVGANAGYNFYGSQKTRQTYRFSDGSATETDVEVSNNFITFNVVGRADLRTSGMVIPYVSGQAGLNVFYTDLFIADPNDADGCKPLENATLTKDAAFSATGGAGVRVDVASVFKKAAANRFFVDFSANYTQGGRVNYMNVNIPADPDPVAHQQHTSVPRGDVTPFSTRFINPGNQVVHEHHVGDVYNSPIQMMSFRLALVMRVVR